MSEIRYYSTNRHLTGRGAKPFTGTASFREALLAGQAPDGGLFLPERFPALDRNDRAGLRDRPYWEAARLVLEGYLGETLRRDELEAVVRDAYDYPVPLEKVTGRKYVLRLDQGPTASFKDFAARLMSRLMSRLKDPESRLNVLVATSGDTGSAIGEAFKGVEGIDVCILYPRQEVSPRQKKQLDTIGGNVRTLTVEGKFDDCQDLVKRAFLDSGLRKLNLTSANSINIGRVLPQSIYYIWAGAQIAEPGEEIVVSVPSGNFGNALGCEIARRMGLPLRKLLMPTNANREFPNFLASGDYRKIAPSLKCLSNAMNVGHPSNLARFFDLYGGTVDKDGKVHRRPDLDELRRRIFSVSVSDGETRETIVRAWRENGLLLEPHGAVGWKGLQSYLSEQGDFEPCLAVETAHPAKFPEEIESLLGISPKPPESLKNLDARSGEPIPLPCDYAAFRGFLLDSLRGR